jgi:FlaA1/EpsC-like NDP-sugar epimerase
MSDTKPFRHFNLALAARSLLLLDLLAVGLSFVISLALRFDAPSPQFDQYLGAYAWVILVLAPVRILALLWLRLYSRVWRYASTGELMAIVLAGAASTVVAYPLVFATAILAGPQLLPSFPRSVPLIDTLLVVTLTGLWRFAFAAAARRDRVSNDPEVEHALIVTDGEAGLAVVRELRLNSELKLRPVGFLHAAHPAGQHVLGLPILGGMESLADVITRHGIRVVVLALPSADGKLLRRLARIAHEADARCFTVPSFAEVAAGRVTVSALRELEVEDLLRRAPARIDDSSVARAFAGRTVLITGAGGSIGSELSRQIARFGPRHLILLGRGEYSIFEVLQTLREVPRNTTVTPVILDIRARGRLAGTFERFRPDVVFHAAAHKHVHFMEAFPDEAVSTNVIGSANVIDAAIAADVQDLVVISTDKAVNPTSVMGATKRLAELLVIDAAARTGRRYSSVRFGNVLSSRGSVVPLFRSQLERGDPLTITHPDVERYFMTIPEAVQLVLQAAVFAKPGDVFVLDMGSPVRILDLARDLAKLHGVDLDESADVRFVGLQPGEKLTEELYSANEVPQPTAHEAIWRVGAPVSESLESAGESVARLSRLVEDGSGQEIRDALMRAVPEYSSTPRVALLS